MLGRAGRGAIDIETMSIAQDEIAGQITLIKREWKETVESLNAIASGAQVPTGPEGPYGQLPLPVRCLTACPDVNAAGTLGDVPSRFQGGPSARPLMCCYC